MSYLSFLTATKKPIAFYAMALFLFLSTLARASPDCPILSAKFQGFSNGATSDPSNNGWYLDLANTGDAKFFAVRSNRIMAEDLGGEGVWYSGVYSSEGYADFQIATKIHSEGDMNSNEYVKVFYKLDNGPEVLIQELRGNFGTIDVQSPFLNGSHVQFVVRMYNYDNGGSQTSKYYIEDYRVFKEKGECNSSPPALTDCVGGVLWLEDFNDLPNGTEVDNGSTAWSIDDSQIASGYMKVEGSRFEFRGSTTDSQTGIGVWRSEVINITNASDVVLSLDVSGAGSLDDGEDYLRIYYRLNGGSEILFPNGDKDGGFSAETLTTGSLSGNTVQIVIRSRSTGDSEFHFVDNVSVEGSGSGASFTVSASASGNIDCENQSVTLSANTNASSPSYSWRNESNNVIGSSQSISVSTAGTYTVTVTSGGCSATADVTVVDDQAGPGVEASASGTIGCDGGSVQLFASSVSGASYLWTGPSFSSNSQNPTVNNVGTYTVVATDPSSGCSSSASVTVRVSSGDTQTLWLEDFEALSDGTTNDNGNTSWTTDNTGGGNIEVEDGELAIADIGADNMATWTSGSINISNLENAEISVSVRSEGDMEDSGSSLDMIQISYKINNGSEIHLEGFEGSINDNSSTPTIVSSNSLSGNALQIIVRARTTSPDEIYFVDNITVTGTSGASSSFTAEATVSGEITCVNPSVQLLVNTDASSPTYLWEGPNGYSSSEQSPFVSTQGDYTVTVTSGACSASDVSRVHPWVRTII